jgi:hypothetical protein
MVRVRKIREEIADARKRGVLIQIEPDVLEQLVDHAVARGVDRKKSAPLTEDDEDHRRIQRVVRRGGTLHRWEDVKRELGL